MIFEKNVVVLIFLTPKCKT